MPNFKQRKLFTIAEREFDPASPGNLYVAIAAERFAARWDS
jgi:hypothetical protein